MADFTHIRVASGFCYLAALLDACSRKVVGHAVSRNIDTTLTLALAALRSAVQSRKPPAGCIFHTDRGSQYASDTLPAGPAGSRTARINAFTRQSVSRCTGRELHEDMQGLRGLDKRLRNRRRRCRRLPRFIEAVYKPNACARLPAPRRVRKQAGPASSLDLIPHGPVAKVHCRLRALAAATLGAAVRRQRIVCYAVGAQIHSGDDALIGQLQLRVLQWAFNQILDVTFLSRMLTICFILISIELQAIEFIDFFLLALSLLLIACGFVNSVQSYQKDHL
ncbi:MAG: DDE-type integrase/transposase/recombinase [Rhodoferax sp.]|nr:DDE-type integrase/transposase/recombinase [Rhodoferax sp.]